MRDVGEGTEKQLRAPMRELAEQSRKSNVLFTRQGHTWGHAGKAERSQQVGKVNTHFSRADTHEVSSRCVNGTRRSHRQQATTQAPGRLEGGQMTSAGEDVGVEPLDSAGGRQ